jgi:putative heme-binding domain-containing protein
LIAAPVASIPPKGPGRVWNKESALAALDGKLEKQDFKQGRNLYHATSCSKCHRIGGEGGAIGPDLSTAAKKFSISDMLDAIIEPSKAISDQYGSHQVLTEDGTVLVGRTVEIGDEYYVYTADANAKPTILKKADVEQITPSKVSQMPSGLIDTLNPEELKALVAYLMASGDPKAKYYK